MPSGRTPQRVERRRPGPARPWRQRLSIPLAVGGAILFFTGYMGAILGFQVLPFDQHHMLAQIGGLVGAIVGLSWLGARR